MTYFYSEPIAHHGILGMKWGVRRYQNTDGTLTEEGKKRYGDSEPGEKKKMSTGKKVAIGVGIAAGAAAVAGAAALIATGKYKEIPDLINRGKEKVQMALIKAGKGDLVYGNKHVFLENGMMSGNKYALTWDEMQEMTKQLNSGDPEIRKKYFSNSLANLTREGKLEQQKRYDQHLRRVGNSPHSIISRLPPYIQDVLNFDNAGMEMAERAQQYMKLRPGTKEKMEAGIRLAAPNTDYAYKSRNLLNKKWDREHGRV